MDRTLRWRKSSYSGGDNGNCVEVAHTSDAALSMLRDSKNPGVALSIASPALASLVRLLGR
jgi:hypothetical protein